MTGKVPTVVVCAYHTVGYRCLAELLRQGADIRLVFSHEDSATENIWFESVPELARQHGITCLMSTVNDPASTELVRQLKPDFIFSFYYRTMIEMQVLNIACRGSLNLHGSYLPKYRGRVPINWAVINGETETGATLHYMIEKPDAGEIVDQEKITIAFTDTAFDVFTKVTDAAVTILRRAWPLLLSGTAPRLPMDLSAGSYFGGRRPEDGRIDWSGSAVKIYNLIRGVTHPYPGAFTHLEGKKITIWSGWPVSGHAEPGRIVSTRPLAVGTGDGLLEIRSLQIELLEEMTADEFTERGLLQADRFI